MEKKADKRNTHYLTDSIIRTCLDYDNGNKRERGFYFNISNDSHLVRFGFQRRTPPELVRQELKREPTDEETERAKTNPFTADWVFCKDCEDFFGGIEKPFDDEFHKKLNAINVSGHSFVEVMDARKIKIVRLFFILQYWRSHVCNTAIKLNQKTAKEFREIILKYDSVDENLLRKYPMAVSYIASSNQMDHGRHFVGMVRGSNPYVIFMNDFVVQLYDYGSSYNFYSLYGLNDRATYKDLVNFKEDVFKIQIVQSDAWRKVADIYYQCEIKPIIIQRFVDAYRESFQGTPNLEEINSFLAHYESNRKSLSLTDEMLNDAINLYFEENHGYL